MWVKWDSIEDQKYIIQFVGSPYTNGKGRIRWNWSNVPNGVNSQFIAPSPGVEVDMWYHIVFVFDRDGKRSIYRNGQLWSEKQNDFIERYEFAGGGLRIGSNGHATGQFAGATDGVFDEFAIWKRVHSR